MKEKLTKKDVDKLKNIMEEQEKQRSAEDVKKLEVEKMLKEFKEKEASIIEEELSLSLEEIYGDDTAKTMLKKINEYIPNYAKDFKDDSTKRQYYVKAGNELFEQCRLQEAIFAYKKAVEYGNVKFSTGKTHFDLNFDVAPYLAIGRVFEQEKQYDKAMAFYNKAINTKDKFTIKKIRSN